MIFVFLFSFLRDKHLSQENIKFDPPLWFSGLKKSEFLLTINGTNIGYFDVSISSIPIINSTKLDSPNYLFVYLNMNSVKPGTYNINLINGQEKYVIPYEIRSLRDPRPRTFDSTDVIYLIMPDRFSNGNTSNDNIPMKYPYKVDREDPDARHGGDLLGIENHLDYLEELGVTSLWLTPILENDVASLSYHGYAATDMYKVDSRLGTNEDYQKLVEKCHSHHIKMIQDFVFNHVSSEHPWMLDPPTKDFFNYYDKYIQTQNDLTTAFSPYASDYDKEILTKGWFVESMPDLNQRNLYLARYLIQTSIFWIEYADIDGIRMDTYPYAFPEFMANWAKEVLDQYPDFNIVGETFRTNSAAVSFWQMGSKYNLNKTYLKTVMDFHLMDICHDTFFNSEKMYNLHDHMSYDFLYSNVSNLLRFFENHDTDRFFLEQPSDLKAYKQAMAFLLTIPGIPQIYYATEVLMTGKKGISDGYLRKDFPGGWPNDTVNYFTEEGRKDDPLRSEAFDYLKTLLNYRKGNEVISKGSMKHFYPMTGVYAYQRKYKDQAILVFLNGNDNDHIVELEQYQEVLQNGIKFKNILTNEIMYLNKSFTLKPREALILELQINSGPIPPSPIGPENATLKKLIISVCCCCGGVFVFVIIALAYIYAAKYSKKTKQLNEDPLISLRQQNK